MWWEAFPHSLLRLRRILASRDFRILFTWHLLPFHTAKAGVLPRVSPCLEKRTYCLGQACAVQYTPDRSPTRQGCKAPAFRDATSSKPRKGSTSDDKHQIADSNARNRSCSRQPDHIRGHNRRTTTMDTLAYHQKRQNRTGAIQRLVFPDRSGGHLRRQNSKQAAGRGDAPNGGAGVGTVVRRSHLPRHTACPRYAAPARRGVGHPRLSASRSLDREDDTRLLQALVPQDEDRPAARFD